MASSVGALSGSSDPYSVNSYKPESTDKNTITMTGFFQLLAVQLQNQDMTNPMDNSELMAQMTQMAMMQSMNAMTDATKNSTSINTQTYAASLVGQEVTMAVTKESPYGEEIPVDVKYAKVEYVNFATGDPTIKLEGDSKEYTLKHLIGMGKVPNPFVEDIDSDQETDESEGTGSSGESEGSGEGEQGPGVNA